MAVYLFLAPIGHTNIIFSICNVVGDWTMLILLCFPNSNAFLVCFCRFYEGINGIQWKSGSPRAAARDLQLGCYPNLEGRDVACGGWRHDASSRGKERGPMERAFERKGPRVPPAFCSNWKPQKRHWSGSRCFNHSEGFGVAKNKSWRSSESMHRLNVSCTKRHISKNVKSNCSEANHNFSMVQFSGVELWQIQHQSLHMFNAERRWMKWYVCICLHRHAPDDVRIQFDLC